MTGASTPTSAAPAGGRPGQGQVSHYFLPMDLPNLSLLGTPHHSHPATFLPATSARDYGSMVGNMNARAPGALVFHVPPVSLGPVEDWPKERFGHL